MNENVTVTATAISVSRMLPIRRLANCFVEGQVRASRKNLVVTYDDARFAFVFDIGAVVFIGLSKSQQGELIERILEESEYRDEDPKFEEDFVIEVNPALQTFPTVYFDRLVLPELRVSSAEVVARLLAQSATLERYELELDAAIAALDGPTQSLSRWGRVGVGRSEVLQLVATSIATKNRIFGKLSLLDKPDLAWEEETMDDLHNKLRASLELEDRFHAVELKLRAVQETLTLLLDIIQSRQALLLEATIVVLIAIEIGLALFHVT